MMGVRLWRLREFCPAINKSPWWDWPTAEARMGKRMNDLIAEHPGERHISVYYSERTGRESLASISATIVIVDLESIVPAEVE